MKKIIKLTESDLARIVKKVLKEENYSEEDLPYTHPKTGDSCKVKVALFKPAAEKGEMKYHAVLVCDYYGDEMITATLPVIKNSFEEVSDFICKNLDRTYELLDEMLGGNEEKIFEKYENPRFKVIDKPINCKVSLYDENY
jgi:hypothetical protein